MFEEKAVNEREMADVISCHIPLEGAGCGEPGDAGCSCGADYSKYGYTWKGYCRHLAEVVAGTKS